MRDASRSTLRLRIARVYLGGCCAVCKSVDSLEFDHVDPETKEFDISTGAWRATEVAFWREVEKCQLLCRDHHTLKTRNDAVLGAKRGRPAKTTSAMRAEMRSQYDAGRTLQAIGLDGVRAVALDRLEGAPLNGR